MDYTLYLNLVAVAVVATMLWLARRKDTETAHEAESSWSVQDIVTGIFILVLAGGLVAAAL